MMHYKLFILALVGSYTFGQGGFMFKRPKPELIEKKPPFINEVNVDSVSVSYTHLTLPTICSV